MIDLRVINNLTREMGMLATVTSQPAWAEGDTSCKIIPTSHYVRALTIAIALAKENPQLDMPVPGADPDGFIWLTYRDGDTKGIALELRPGTYKWTQNNMGDKRSFESTSLNDVAEAFRTVFPPPACLR